MSVYLTDMLIKAILYLAAVKYSENQKYLIAVLFSPKVAFLSIFSKSTKDLILKSAKHPLLLLSLLCISGIK